MSKLISGKEAKLAWANGEIVQIRNVIVGEDFYDLNGDNAKLGVFDLDFYEFRLKPKTITINGVEVPAPFNPKKGDKAYKLTSTANGFEYTINYNKKYYSNPYGWWRTEDEIKQVVDALKIIFK